jgi:hypothetical protein
MVSIVLGDLTLEFLTPNVPHLLHIHKRYISSRRSQTGRFMFLTIKVQGCGLYDFLDHII